jgi:hypothetical protein
MNRPTTEPQFNPYTDEVEVLSEPVKPPIDDDPDILDASHNDDLEDLEFTLSEHEFNREPSYTQPFKEEHSSGGSSFENNYYNIRRKVARRKNALIGTAFVLVIVIITVAVAASLSKRNNQNGGTELSVSEAVSEPVQNNNPASTEQSKEVDLESTLFPAFTVDTSEETPEASPVASLAVPSAPFAAPAAAPYSAPIAPFAAFAADASPIASPIAMTDAPTQIPLPTGSPNCHSKAVYIDKDCYTFGETIQVTFENCHQGQWDWVGLYREVEGVPLDLNVNLMYWTYSCGNSIGPCRPAPSNGILPFPALEVEGTYSFQLVEGVMPYRGMSSSPIFRVASDCYAVDGGDDAEYDEAAIEGGPTNIPDEIMEAPETEVEKEAEWMDGN